MVNLKKGNKLKRKKKSWNLNIENIVLNTRVYPRRYHRCKKIKDIKKKRKKNKNKTTIYTIERSYNKTHKILNKQYKRNIQKRQITYKTNKIINI